MNTNARVAPHILIPIENATVTTADKTNAIINRISLIILVIRKFKIDLILSSSLIIQILDTIKLTMLAL